jgi:hypothetical protein
MATNRVRYGRRRGAVVFATGALLALAVSPAFAHTSVTSSTDARHVLLAAEQVGAGRDEVDELEQLEQDDQADQADQGNVDAADAGQAGDQGETGGQGDSAAPRIQGGHFVEKKADKSAPLRQATKSHDQSDDGAENDDQGDDNDDLADTNDDHEQGAETGETGGGGGGGDSGESGD